MSATTKILAGTSATAIAVGTYLLVTNSGSNNQPVEKVFIPPMTFDSPRIERRDGITYISFQSDTNYYYGLETKFNLIDEHWLNLFEEARGNGGIRTLTDNDSQSPHKFYRLWRGAAPKLPPAYPPGNLVVTNTGQVL